MVNRSCGQELPQSCTWWCPDVIKVRLCDFFVPCPSTGQQRKPLPSLSWEQCCLLLPCSQGEDEEERGPGLSWKAKLPLPPPRWDFLFFLGCVSAHLRSALPFFLVKSQGIKCDGRGDLGQTPASPDDKHQWLEVSAETSVCLCECFSDVLNVIAVTDLSKEVIAAKSGCLSMDTTLAHVLIWRQHGQNQ